MLKMLKVLQGIHPPFFEGGGSIPQKTFNNIFNISPGFKHFFRKHFWKFLTFLTFPQFKAFFLVGGGVNPPENF